MGLINIPCYAYIDGGTRGVTNQIIADDSAYQTLKQVWESAGKPTSSYSMIARWQDSTYTTEQSHKVLNDYFNSYVISNKLKFYVANTLTPGTDISAMLHDYGVVGIVPYFFAQTTNTVTKLVTLDNVDLFSTYTGSKVMGQIAYDSLTQNSSSTGVNFVFNSINMTTATGQVNLELIIYPSDITTGDSITGGSYSDLNDPVFRIKIMFSVNGSAIDDIVLYWNGNLKGYDFANLVNFYNGVNVHTPGTTEDDLENPYGYDGTSTTGGGNGKYGDIDGIEATDIPNLPTINAASLGLITLYNPSAATINSLANYLWSGMFDPDTFKKLFADPMGCMIGLSIVPATSGTGGTKNIKFGSTDTGISCSYLSSNYCSVDCGSLSIDEYVGSFMDYEPYCKISIFLPYIGFKDLSADDLMGGSINVVYHIDVLSGNCIAFIHHSVKGVMYSYSGTCITNIPLTAQSYASALQSYYTGLAGVLGTAVGSIGGGAAGLATTAGQLATTAMNQLFNSKPQFQRSGSAGGASGIMGVQTPFLIIQRPRFSVPNQVQKYIGQTSNISSQLGSLSGFTMVEYIHLHGIAATSEELAEIEAKLKEGVIL